MPTTTLDATRSRIEARLAALVPSGQATETLNAALADALLAPGKRLRPLMTVLVAEDLGGDTSAALDVGCAIEMVHAASLVLDDLPSMDDAAMRRGRPAVHRAHGEDSAILAAVALLSHAYGVAAAANGLSAERRLDCVAVLARAIGMQGLVAGQFHDLRGGLRERPLGEIVLANAQKTGALFSASIECGAAVAGTKSVERAILAEAAHELGQAFQLLDDLLDIEASAERTGKTPGRDEGKSTVVALLGQATVRRRIERHAEEAHIRFERVFGEHGRLPLLVESVLAGTPASFPSADRSTGVLGQEAGAF